MSPEELPTLCGVDACRLLAGHAGEHNRYPTEVWGFMGEKDSNKLSKAGFATPRGGAKGGYQNHVLRNGRAIVPYEKLDAADIKDYKDGYTIRLRPEQYFETQGKARPEFEAVHAKVDAKIEVGKNAFVLYRNYESFATLPPLEGWEVCRLEKDGKVLKKREPGAKDIGHYILRLSKIGEKLKKVEGAPQGLFAPEYADEETNYFCKCILAWLIVHTEHSPYTTSQAPHLKAVLAQAGLLDDAAYEFRGIIRHGLAACPLCLQIIGYDELHKMVKFDEGLGADNAASQVEGSTRSTIVNLFHLIPLTYDAINHLPINMAWGHATCNTRLGQRPCKSLAELQQNGMKVGVVLPDGIETFGWISKDWEMIRSPKGAVWIKISRDQGEPQPKDADEDVLSKDVVHDDVARVTLEADAGDDSPENDEGNGDQAES